MWTIFKVFIEFAIVLFMFWFFGIKACGILVSPPGIKPTPLALEGKNLNHWTTTKVPEFNSLFKPFEIQRMGFLNPLNTPPDLLF